jgi:hypothetical protein
MQANASRPQTELPESIRFPFQGRLANDFATLSVIWKPNVGRAIGRIITAFAGATRAKKWTETMA